MTKLEIENIIDNSFNEAFSAWSKSIGKELYPSAFADEYSWLRVKKSIELNNQFLKSALKLSLSSILADE